MTAPLPGLLKSLGTEVAEKANLVYITVMNKRKRVADLKHRRKQKKLEERRKAQLQAPK